MSSADVKIPPDWLRVPPHETRSQLLDARRGDRREWVLARTAAPSVDRKFARSETLFRDWFRRSGVFDSPRSTPATDGSASVTATRSSMLAQRQAARRVESLAFEPQEIERLADRPRASELREWWKQRDGYVEDPMAHLGDSTRLELMRRRGRVIPGGGGGGGGGNAGDDQDAGSNQRGDARLQRARRKQLEVTPKVTRVRHLVPDAYLGADRSEAATIQRADDLYAQERLSVNVRTMGGAGGFGALAEENKWSLPISPIKGVKPVKRSVAQREGLFADGLAQRSMLDQLKTAAASLPPVGSPSPPMLSPLTRHHQQQHAGSADESPVRCGGFS